MRTSKILKYTRKKLAWHSKLRMIFLMLQLSEELGKTAGKDEEVNKTTYVKLLGLEKKVKRKLPKLLEKQKPLYPNTVTRQPRYWALLTTLLQGKIKHLFINCEYIHISN